MAAPYPRGRGNARLPAVPREHTYEPGGRDRPCRALLRRREIPRRPRAPQWRRGLDPWTLTVEGERWYGRGTADNKSQHLINMLALEQVIAERGRLGFNCKFLIETGEEIGSPGLREICTQENVALAGDLLIGSDGPRLTPARPTVYMGTRGAVNFDLVVDLREGGHHSGNWGGLLANPGAILANAIASIIDEKGRVK